MIKQVEFNTQNENAFYGMSNTLSIFQNASKGQAISESILKDAWAECKDDNQKAVLLSILFSIGDITARQHNIFETKVENGGNSQREIFRDNIIPFLVKNTKKKDMMKLMTLISEYTTMDNIFANRVVTKKKSNQYIKTINMISVFGIDNVAQYASEIIHKGTTFQKMCLAKFVSRPRQSKRSKATQMLPQTQKVMKLQVNLLEGISDLANLAYEDKGSYIDFTGFYKWRQEFNHDLESVVFSSGKIKELDKEEFLKWLGGLPSDARFRVRNRVLFDEAGKWGDLGKWYKEWEKFKETAQSEQRVLETKIANGVETKEDVTKLKTVKKQAKVNVGAISFDKMFKDIVNGVVDKIKVQPFLDKINLPYNTLTFIDDSRSMNMPWGNSYGFNAMQFGAFMATICLMKNPDNEAKSLMGLFSSECRMVNGVSKVNIAPNSLLSPNIKKTVRKSLINPELHFLENLSKMSQFIKANQLGRGTDISSVLRALGSWAQESPNNVEELQRYPVWTFISDGNFNNKRTVANSIADFFKQTSSILGFKPYIILIDVANNSSAKIENFEGIDNVMMVPPNPAAIELFLTNFRDMDTFDVYTPLQSVYRSKRYSPIRALAYGSVKKAIKAEKELI